MAELLHERPPLRRVDDLGHVLAGDVEDVGIVVVVAERLDLGGEALLLLGELEIHDSLHNLTGRQILPSRVPRIETKLTISPG